MSQPKTVDPGHLGPLAPVGMPPSRLHLLDVASPPARHGRCLRALVVAMALRDDELSGTGSAAPLRPQMSRETRRLPRSGWVALASLIIQLSVCESQGLLSFVMTARESGRADP